MTTETTNDDRSTNPDDYSNDVAAALVAAANEDVSYTGSTRATRMRRRSTAAITELVDRDAASKDNKLRASDLTSVCGTEEQLMDKAEELEE